MRARHRPCSAPLRQAGGIPGAAEPGHPRRGNTPCFHACPSPAGRGEYRPRPLRRPTAAAVWPALGNVRCFAGEGQGWDGGKQRTLHRSNRPEPGHAEGEPGRPVCLGATFWEGGAPRPAPLASGRLRLSPSESRGGRRGGGGTGWGYAAWARRGPRGRAVPEAPYSTPCAEEAGRGRGPTTMGLAGAINTRPRLYLVWPDHKRGAQK